MANSLKYYHLYAFSCHKDIRVKSNTPGRTRWRHPLRFQDLVEPGGITSIVRNLVNRQGVCYGAPERKESRESFC